MGAHLHMVWDQGALWTCQRLVTYCSLMLIERECWCPVITDGDHIVMLTFNRKSSDRTHIVLSGMRSKFGNQHLLKKRLHSIFLSSIGEWGPSRRFGWLATNSTTCSDIQTQMPLLWFIHTHTHTVASTNQCRKEKKRRGTCVRTVRLLKRAGLMVGFQYHSLGFRPECSRTQEFVAPPPHQYS